MSRYSSFDSPVSEVNLLSGIPAIRLATKFIDFQVGAIPTAQHGPTATRHDAAVHEAGIGHLWTFGKRESWHLNVCFSDISVTPDRY